MFWLPLTADCSSLYATSGVARLTKASIGMKFDPLEYIGYFTPANMEESVHQRRLECHARTIVCELEEEHVSTIISRILCDDIS